MPSTNQGRQPELDACTDSLCQAAIPQRPSLYAERCGVACTTGDRLAYVSPKVEKSVLDDGRPQDVVAEWSGLTPTHLSCDVATAGSPTPKGLSNESVDWSPAEPASIRSAIWKRQDDVLEYAIDRDALLFHPEMKLLCQLNETAFFIWRHCDGRCVEDLALMLTNAFHVDLDTATDHALRIIELFSISGFVVEEPLHAVAS